MSHTAAAPQPVLRKDYKAPAYRIEKVDLRFALDPLATEVTARMEVKRTPGASADATLVLDGEEPADQHGKHHHDAGKSQRQ